MKERHLALIVEDESATAQDLAEIVAAIGCDSRIASSKSDALALLDKNDFCVILLDLQIKGEPDAIKGHTAHGNALLREIRRRHSGHVGTIYSLPVVVVSGFAREVPAAVEVMQDGADGVIQKPFKTRQVSDEVSRALDRSGRKTHAHCASQPSLRLPDDSSGVVLAIPGDRIKNRTRVTVGAHSIPLPNNLLRLLLRLMLAYDKKKRAHKLDLGGTAHGGFKLISLLKAELRPALEGREIIDNDYRGSYGLTDDVTIGDCNVDRLVDIGDATISALARELGRRLKSRRRKSEGKI